MLKQNTNKLQSQYLSLKTIYKFKKFFSVIEDIETSFFRKKFNHDIDNPVFILGLARSGTSILSHYLYQFDNFTSFTYKNLPYIQLPIIWNYLSKLYYLNNQKFKRIHDDDIIIDKHTPDSFEEIFWQLKFSNYDENKLTFLEDTQDPIFANKYKNLIMKLLYINQCSFYFSKNNNSIFRIKLLLKIFKNSKFIICIRNPIEQCHSLARVHKLFIKEQNKNKKFSKIMSMLGHFEFGDTRAVPSTKNASIINEFWNNGQDYEGYCYLWHDIYDYILNNWNPENFLLFDNNEAINNNKYIYKVNEFLNFSKVNQNNINFKKNKNIYRIEVKSDIEKENLNLLNKIKKYEINKP